MSELTMTSITPAESRTAAALPQPMCLPNAFQWRRCIPAIVAATIALLLIPFANRTAKPIFHMLHEAPLRSAFQAAEQFPTYLTILLTMGIVWTLDVRRRTAIIYLAVALITSGTINEVLKEIAGRTRPEFSTLMHESQEQEIESYAKGHPNLHIIATKFDHWLGVRTAPYFLDRYESFPSGHTNAALVLFAFLVMMYPDARWVWLIVTLLCGLARVRARRHYMEDILFGGALGWIIALWVFSWRWPEKLGRRFGFDRACSRRDTAAG
jgi:membrane-associated phospholipid phosphatase